MPALATTTSRRPSSVTLPDGGGERVEVTDVDLAGHDPPILFLDQRHGLGEVLRGRSRVLGGVQRATDVDGDDVGALGGQAHRLGPALPACRARDQGDLADETAADRACRHRGGGDTVLFFGRRHRHPPAHRYPVLERRLSDAG
jgi:hypothetical protein